MASRSSEAGAFHEFELQGWQRAADPYHRYFGALTRQAIGPLLDAVTTAPPSRKSLLDIASGPGYVAAEAARRGWSPVGVDFSGSMVAIARRLHPGLDFRMGDAESLPFPNASFDAATMNFGILHLAQPETAMGEAFRVLRTGGCFAFSAWRMPEQSAGFRIVLEAVEEFGDPRVPLPPGPPFFRFGDPDESCRVLQSRGFSDVATADAPLVWRLETPGDFFEAFLQGSARTGGLLRAQAEPALAKIREAIQKRVAACRRDGRLEISMPALIVSGRKT